MVNNNGTMRGRQKPLIQYDHDNSWSCGVDHDSFNLKILLPKWQLTFDAVRRLVNLGFSIREFFYGLLQTEPTVLRSI
jgi:hypothetical protein